LSKLLRTYQMCSKFIGTHPNYLLFASPDAPTRHTFMHHNCINLIWSRPLDVVGGVSLVQIVLPWWRKYFYTPTRWVTSLPLWHVKITIKWLIVHHHKHFSIKCTLADSDKKLMISINLPVSKSVPRRQQTRRCLCNYLLSFIFKYDNLRFKCIN
jgi:hypothetical protein